MTFYEHYLKERIESFYHGSPYEFDTFDINKAGSGDGLNKFGYGLYFTDNEELANFYASELIGKGKERGYNIYEVQLRDQENFYRWDEATPEDIYNKVIQSLENKGYESDAQEIKDDYESYGDRWTIDSLYQFLEAIFKDKKKVTQFLNKNGISGVIADDIDDRGTIYVAYADNIIKIKDRWKMGKRND